MRTTRRNVVKAAGGLIAAASIPGCSLTKKPKPICLYDPKLTDADSILAIDVHNHIFNATDLQVADFTRLVASRQSEGLGNIASFFGELLQEFAWRTAPSAAAEIHKIKELKLVFEECADGDVSDELAVLRDDRYAKGKSELEAAVEELVRGIPGGPESLDGSIESLPPSRQGMQQILKLPESYEELFAAADEEVFGEEFPEKKSVRSALKFVMEMFQYRFVSVYNYLKTYNVNSRIKIDLMTPAPVDYDWWLSSGRATKSSLPDQMRLMKEISIITGGRVQALVPFDPLRQAIHDLGIDSGFSPLDLVRKSVSEYGVIGVKIYPPMGFAPYANERIAAKQPCFWSRHRRLPDITRRDDFAKRLDNGLRSLYEYCRENDVPVMGHSNVSNGPSDQFEELTSPTHWGSAVTTFEGVPFSFGHFGGAGSKSSFGESNVEGFLRLMEGDERSNRKKLAADASYFSNVLEEPDLLRRVLKAVFAYGDTTPKPAIKRLMYGADWKMLIAEADSGGYLNSLNSVVEALSQELDEADLKKRFFGENAADFYGLRKGRANRARLDVFYEKNGFSRQPVWMDKLDSQS